MVHLVLASLGFPLWLRLSHYVSLLFIGLLIRSGIEILGAHPRFYWNDGCTPGTEWIKFTKKKVPTEKDVIYTARDDEIAITPFLALPGKKNLGLGRHWHGVSNTLWLLNGIIYVVLLFATDEWSRLIPTSWDIFPRAWHSFRDWHLEVKGLVKRPLCLSLEEIRALPSQVQITKHNCVQGWSGVGKWKRVPLTEILNRCEPLSEARYLKLTSYGLDQFTYGGKPRQPFYEVIDMTLATHPQTMLAYELNDEPLPLPHGAPLRLRVETQLGYKMAKYLRSIELTADYRSIGEGQGGSREDTMFYGRGAEI